MTYADGTSGHSGSDTSQARAERERDDGTKSYRETQVIAFLASRGGYGATYKELGEFYGWHHGQASSVLSTLHQDGQIVRLTERRNRCKVYVSPLWDEGRPREPHGGHKAERDLAIKMVESVRLIHQPARGITYAPDGRIVTVLCAHERTPWPCPTAIAVGLN
jgi:hypothetical protein